jgi:hypothetical protein
MLAQRSESRGSTMKLLQIVPRNGRRFFGDIVRKQEAIRKNGRGTFSRSGRKRKDSARWTHAKFKGSVDIAGISTELVTAKVKSRVKTDESKLASAFLGWIDRHFGDELVSVTIHYH